MARQKTVRTLVGIRTSMRTGCGQASKIAVEGTISEGNRDILGWLTLDEARQIIRSLSHHIEQAEAEETRALLRALGKATEA